MIPFSIADRVSLSEVARDLGINISTVWRWTLRGVRGRKLRTVVVGGRRFVLRTDLAAFLNAANDPTSIAPDIQTRADDAGRVLDALGVKAKAPS
jgi:hypothetical protein